MLAMESLIDWLARFKLHGGRLQITCNGMGVMASNHLGNHFFSLQGYSEQDVNKLIDAILPYLC